MTWKKIVCGFLALLLICGSGNLGTALANTDELTRIVLSKNELTMETGDTQSLKATAVYLSGKTEDVTISTDWNSENISVATVHAGTITAKDVGTSVIKAEYKGKLAVATLSVTKKLKALTVDQQTVDLRKGDEVQLILEALYSDGEKDLVTQKADWIIDNSSIATVTNGLIKGHGSGTASITAKFGRMSVVIPVSVEIARRLEPDKKQVSLLTGKSYNIQLKAIYPDGSFDENVEALAEWSSDNEGVADAIKGEIKAYGPGTAVITAKYGTKTVAIQVDVDTTRALTVSEQDLYLKIGDKKPVTLTAIYADGKEEPVTSVAEWSSDKPDIVSVSKGVIMAHASGEAVITAKYAGKTIQIRVDVEVPRYLDPSPSYLGMRSGDSKQIKLEASFVSGKPENITDKAEWTSSNSDIAYVKNGYVTAYKAGTATITAKYGGKQVTIPVDVDLPQKITLNKTALNLQIGDSYTLTANVLFSNGDSEDITSKAEWKSSSENVATVRQGSVIGVGTGAATITASYANRSVSLSVNVGVIQSITPSEKKLVMKNGETETITLKATYTDESTKDITAQAEWKSSKPDVAQVVLGKVTALSSGKATISAVFDGKTISIPVEVDQAQTLNFEPRMLVLTVNESADITLTATDASGKTVKVTEDAEWKSSNAKVADVNKGHVVGYGSGRATITATYGGKTVSIPVEVGIVTTLEASKRFVQVKTGKQVQVSLTAKFSDGRTTDVTNDAEWKVSGYKVADVSNGLISGIGYGKTTVTAKYNGKTVSIPVEVDMLKYLKTDVVQIEMKKGETKKVTAIATYTDGSEEDVTKPALWTTSRLLTADVKDGVIKATGPGKATITVTYGGKRTPIVVIVK
ncbi:Ig-like domain-containing protein [Brevibacillus ruminantium]|uniref:Ig-like domain-containing protein n=1 Tax=Brevibacillus ruminantium TaxID=2950604 RepID=A0ABY4WC50_9BACL|nr:Ig-like domain-containing protein [Brevibacillus ruminantium]USG64411.1 Ig-like domain-containing protein [Brevibacillus ruminantium]